MTDSMDRSRYIAFEGAEGAGKSSIAAEVADRLASRGADVVMVREPGGTPVGEAIREILLGGTFHPGPRAEAALFAAARAQLMAEVVAPALTRGAWVLSDRSAYSSLAYQSGARGLPLDEVRALNDIALGGLWPGRVVLLRVDSESGLSRQEVGDRIGSEDQSFHDAVVQTFDRLAAEDPDTVIVVDATQPLEAVVAAVLAALGIAP